MGHGRQSWYTGLEIGNDSDEGLNMRQKMAEDMSEDELTEFMSQAQIPVKFKPVVKRLKRKQGANTELYRHAKNKIGKSEWKSFWGQVKKGTAPGKSRVTTDMVFTLRGKELDVIRRLVNLVLEEGLGVYKQWKRRIITPVPKEEGNFTLVPAFHHKRPRKYHAGQARRNAPTGQGQLLDQLLTEAIDIQRLAAGEVLEGFLALRGADQSARAACHRLAFENAKVATT